MSKMPPSSGDGFESDASIPDDLSSLDELNAQNDAIDEQFRSMMSHIDRDELLDTPSDDSLHLEGGKLSVALVLSPLPSAPALHSLLSMCGMGVNVVRLKPWTAVWLEVKTKPTDEEELDALLTGVRPMPEIVDQVARHISRLSKYGSVALMSWLVEGDGVEPGVSGRISAKRYVGGEPEEDIPAGVLLGAMPQATEDLLLGRTTPADYSDSVLSDGSRRRPGPFGWLKKR